MRYIFIVLLGLAWPTLLSAATPGVPERVVVSIGEVTAAAADTAPEIEVCTGTLIFSQGDCLAVKVFTQSPYTHVAAVVVRDGAAFAYDSTNGAGVRCQPLARYLDSLTGQQIHVADPRKPFSDSEQIAFRSHLDQELGRPYAVAHHVTGNRADGLHCAEYLVDALMAANIMHAERPAKVSPASLAVGVQRNSHYGSLHALQVPNPPEPVLAEDAGWCQRMWFDTKSCTVACCRKLSGWFLCR